MGSSTSHFSQSLPWLTLSLAATAAATWALGAFYTLRLNPEMTFCRRGHHIKQDWLRLLDQEHQSKVAIVGGSSCATSIDPEEMLRRHRLPAVNLGLAAQMGAKVLTRYGLQTLRPGDTLVLNLEPWLLSTPLILEPQGIQFCFAVNNPGVLRESRWVNWPSLLADLRPGSYHLCTLAGKLVLGKKLYRYDPGDWRPGGRQEVTERRPLTTSAPDPPGTPDNPLKLSSDARAFLAHVRADCAARGARVTFALPWYYCPPDRVDLVRRWNLQFLAEVSEFIPPLKDPSFGVQTDASHFSDYVLHLTPEGARLRSAELAVQIKAWDVWTHNELRTAVQAR